MSSLRRGSPGDDPPSAVVMEMTNSSYSNGDGHEEHRGAFVVAGRDWNRIVRLPVAQTEERRLVNDVEFFNLANLDLDAGRAEEVVALSDRRVDEGVRDHLLRRRRERAQRARRRPRARSGAPNDWRVKGHGLSLKSVVTEPFRATTRRAYGLGRASRPASTLTESPEHHARREGSVSDNPRNPASNSHGRRRSVVDLFGRASRGLHLVELSVTIQRP